jgi:hypothetical protein
MVAVKYDDLGILGIIAVTDAGFGLMLVRYPPTFPASGHEALTSLTLVGIALLVILGVLMALATWLSIRAGKRRWKKFRRQV